MAQTKKKRRSKHRGTAAGTIEARGRTGRKPTASERKTSSKDDARARRMARLDKPPTWKGAAQRGVIATVLFAVFFAIVYRKQPAAIAIMTVIVLAIYIPLGYYMDLFVYRRRQRRKQAEQQAKAGAKGSP